MGHCGGGSMAGQPKALETNILVLKALYLMKRSVCGGGSMAGQLQALDTNIIYSCCRPCT